MVKKILLSTVLAASLLQADTVVLTADQLMAKYEKNMNSIDTQGLVKLLKNEPNTKVIDVRIPKDVIKQGGKIKTNRLFSITRDKLEFMIGNILDKPTEKFVIHCYTGNISLLAAQSLKNMGYNNVIWYKDSFKGWKDTGLELRGPDFYPESMLYNKVKKVDEGVYTSIGEMAPGTYENGGQNNNLGLIVGDDAALVWNAGSTYMLAKAFHEEIKQLTDKPVKYVVVENSQSHAIGGMSYWKEQGATVIAHELSAELIHKKEQKQMARGLRKYQDKFLGTKAVPADITFKDTHKIDLGNRIVEARYFGPAHEHDDISLWMPKEKIWFAGDIGFYQRLLPIFEITDTRSWIKILEKDITALAPKTVIPGHGDVTSMDKVHEYTTEYLKYLRKKIEEVLDEDTGLNGAYEIDMSQFEHFDAFDLLGKQNVSRLYKTMEFED
jgi:glyoxylase-like metal-dependent hydrolase (beta-lactamase superfamily II)/rhodanese-related sulfurtransferase